MGLGVLLWGAVAAASDDAPEADAVALERAMEVVEERFVGRVGRGELYRAAIAGMAEHLDDLLGRRGNGLLTEAEARRARAWLRGERVGVGIEFTIVPRRGVLVTGVAEGSPADRAGLEPGDLVVAMDDHPFTGLATAEIHDVVARARQGDRSVLEVRRRDGSVRRVELARTGYRLRGVRLAQDGDPPVIRVAFFGEGAADALAGLLAEAAGASGVALDLRDNAGGMLEEVVAAADLFLPPGAVVYEEIGPDGAARPVRVEGERVWTAPVVLIANRGTRGPAEAFVAALRAHRVATVVGTPTAGEAVRPTFHPLGGGLVLRLADVEMRDPDGGSWAGRGVEPDLHVEAVDVAIAPRPGQAPVDLQREAAVRLVGLGAPP